MKIISFYDLDAENKSFWLNKMNECDWDAGKYLVYLLDNNKFFEACGDKSEVLLLTDENSLIAFCTLAEIDEIDNPDMKPWIGFVYTFTNFRGHRYSGVLIDYAVNEAKSRGYDKIYVSSEEVGLYEKYGFEFSEKAFSVHGYETQIFVKDLN